MYKFSILFVALMTLVVFAESGTLKLREERAVEKYTSRYDNIDVDAILSSSRLLKNYMNCFLDSGPCNSEAKDIKKFIPEAVGNECTKCSDKQKKIIGKVLSRIFVEHREYFDKLSAKYDPEEIVLKKYLPDPNPEDYADYEEA